MGPVTVFVDTSAIVAFILDERGASALIGQLEHADRRLTSPAVRLETCMVLTSRLDIPPLAAQDLFDDFLLQSEVVELAIDERVGRLAVECFERYGKGGILRSSILATVSPTPARKLTAPRCCSKATILHKLTSRRAER